MPALRSSERPVLVLDGDPGPELARRGIVLRPTPGAAPPAIREPAAVRALLRDLALAGSDVLTAPTGALHRRALSRLGAARRGREWIGIALDLVRQAADEADDASRPARNGEPAPRLRLAASVLPLEGIGTSETAPGGATSSEEHRAHAGMLADAGAEVIRIEGMGTIAESEAATRAAMETGLETWTGVVVDGSGRSLPSGESLDTWADAIGRIGPAVLLVAGPSLASTTAALAALAARTGRPLGAPLPAEPAVRPASALGPGPGTVTVPVQASGPGAADEPRDGSEAPREAADGPGSSSLPEGRLLDAGATLVGAGTDASPARIARLRAEADRRNDALRRRRREDLERERAWVAQVTQRAAPGPAAWLGPSPQPGILQGPFAWDLVGADEIGLLPVGRYRVAIVAADPEASGDAARLEALRAAVAALERGAWLLAEWPLAGDALASDERVTSLQPAAPRASGPACWLARRRP